MRKHFNDFVELNDLCNPLTCGSASVSWVERLRQPNMTHESRVAHRCEWYSHHVWEHELRIEKTWINETSNQIKFCLFVNVHFLLEFNKNTSKTC